MATCANFCFFFGLWLGVLYMYKLTSLTFTRECNETSIAGGEKALTRSLDFVKYFIYGNYNVPYYNPGFAAENLRILNCRKRFLTYLKYEYWIKSNFFLNQSIFFFTQLRGARIDSLGSCKSRTHGVDPWSIQHIKVFIINPLHSRVAHMSFD